MIAYVIRKLVRKAMGQCQPSGNDCDMLMFVRWVTYTYLYLRRALISFAKAIVTERLGAESDRHTDHAGTNSGLIPLNTETV